MARRRDSRGSSAHKRWNPILWNQIASVSTTLGTPSLLRSIDFQGGGTILRTRAQWYVWLESAESGDIVSYALAIAKVSQASTGTTAALPDPDPDSDESRFRGFLWHRTGTLLVPSPVITGVTDFHLPSFERIDVDSKAMRVMEEQDSLAFLARATIEAGAGVTMHTCVSGRFLALDA